jgi:hypothetical protein
MAISGHKTMLAFLRYDIASDADKREALHPAEQRAAGSNVIPLKPGESRLGRRGGFRATR